MDAIIASGIMVLGLLTVASYYTVEQDVTLIGYFGNNIMESLSELQVHEVTSPYTKELIANGNITQLNNSILEQIGEFWADGKYNVAFNFTKDIVENLVPESYGVSIHVNGELIYERNHTQSKVKVTAFKLISGLEKGKPVRGWVAKAWAEKIKKTTTEVFAVPISGSGWDGTDANPNWVNITYWFTLPDDANISSALYYISIHNEDNHFANWKVISINDGRCNYTRSQLNDHGYPGYFGEGLFTWRNITSCIHNGTNKVEIILKMSEYNSHIHPGHMIVVNYTGEQSADYPSKYFSKRYYFPNVESRAGVLDSSSWNTDGTGAWSINTFDIPPEATNITGVLHLKAKYDDYRDCRNGGCTSSWAVADVRIYVNDDDYFWRQTHQSNDIDDYYSAGKTAYSAFGVDFDQYFNITPNLVTGTNVVSAYINCEGDDSWGWNRSLIYSNPVNDTVNSSYVEINYTYTPKLVYGTVDITQVRQFGGAVQNPKTGSFQFPPEAIDINYVYDNVAQIYSYLTTVTYGTTNPPPGANVAFRSPSPRAVPTHIYIPETYLDVSELATNYIRMRDDTSGNRYLPESSIEYSFIVPSRVGYGGVFFTKQEAEDDAKLRLNESVGAFISLEQIKTDSNSIKDVPSMWGPAIVEVAIWQ